MPKSPVRIWAVYIAVSVLSSGCGLLPSIPRFADDAIFPPIEDLLLDESAFPLGWHASEIGPRPVSEAPLGGRRSVESVLLSYYDAPFESRVSAMQELYRFEDPGDAAEYYEGRTETLFAESKFRDLRVWPEALSALPLNTHQAQIGCDLALEVTPMQGCIYIARYGLYVVLLDLDWVPEYAFEFSLAETILLAIDEQLGAYGP
jgi:hypothetical protein